MATIENVIKRIEGDIESKEKQQESVLDQLALVDVQIDELQEIINKIDTEAGGYLDIINEKVKKVKDAYDARFNAGCVNNTHWVEVSRDEYEGETQEYEIVHYEVQKLGSGGGTEDNDFCPNPSGAYGTVNFHGLKYVQRPMDRDYGSQLVGSFTGFVNQGDLAVGMTTEQFGNAARTAPSNFKIGDTITDSLSQPTIFPPGDLPEIVSIGTTTIVGIVTTLVGGIDAGSNTFYHFGAGDSSILTTQMILLEPIGSGSTAGFGQYLSGDGYSEITGFGTDYYELSYYNVNGQLSISTITVPTLTLSRNAVGTLAEGTFRVGILTETVGFYISTISSGFTESKKMFVIRSDDSEDIIGDFDPTANPYAPEVLASITDGSSGGIGAGHSISYTDCGCQAESEWNPFLESEDIEISVSGPDIIIEGYDKPEVCAGHLEYVVGVESWPVITDGDGIGGIITQQYAVLGQRAEVQVGGSGTSGQNYDSIGTTNIKPPGSASNSECNSLTNAINNAEDDLQDAIDEYEPQVRDLIPLTRALREEKDRLQLFAWSLLQAGASLRDEIKKLKEAISELGNTDYSKYDN